MLSDLDRKPAANLARTLLTAAPEAPDAVLVRFMRLAPWTDEPADKELEGVIQRARAKLRKEWTDEHKSPEATAALSQAKEEWGTRYLAGYFAQHGEFPTYTDTSAACARVFGSGVNNSKIKKFRGLAEAELAQTDGKYDPETVFQSALALLGEQAEAGVEKTDPADFRSKEDEEFFEDLSDSATKAAEAYREAEAETPEPELWYVQCGYTEEAVQKRVEDAKRAFNKLGYDRHAELSAWLSRAADPKAVLRAPSRKLRRAISGFQDNPLGFATLALMAFPKIFPTEVSRCYEVFARKKLDPTVVRIVAFELGAPYDKLQGEMVRDAEARAKAHETRDLLEGTGGLITAAVVADATSRQALDGPDTEVPIEFLLNPEGKAVMVVPDAMFDRLAALQGDQVNIAVDRAVGALARSLQTNQNQALEEKLDSLMLLLGGLGQRLTDMPSTDALEEKITNLAGRVAASEDTVKQTTSEVKGSVSRLHTRVAEGVETIENLVSPLGARMDALHNRMGEMIGMLEILDKKLETPVVPDFDPLVERIEAAIDAVGSNDNDAVVTQLRALRNDITSSQDEAASQVSALRSEIAAAIGKVGALTEEVKKIKANPAPVPVQPQSRELTLSELVLKGFSVEVQPRKASPSAPGM